MTINRSNHYGPLSPETLHDLEENSGVELPGEYRQFLLEHNGGVPEPCWFVVPGDDEFDGDEGEEVERPFACFFALHDRPWSDDTPEGALGFPLQAAWSDFEDTVLMSNVVPIGKDQSGSYVCIAHQGPERGQVFYFDHDYDTLRPLAADFPSFLAALHEHEVEAE